MFGRAIGNAQELKDSLLAPRLQQRSPRRASFRPSSAPGSPHDIFPETMLVKSPTLFAREEADAAVENVVAGEVDQGSAHFVPGHEEEVDASPHGWNGTGENDGAVPFASVDFGRRRAG